MKKKRKFSSYLRKGSGAKSYMITGLLTYGCAFPHILGSPFSYMTLQPIPSKFPFIWKFFSSFFSVWMVGAVWCLIVLALLITLSIAFIYVRFLNIQVCQIHKTVHGSFAINYDLFFKNTYSIEIKMFLRLTLILLPPPSQSKKNILLSNFNLTYLKTIREFIGIRFTVKETKVDTNAFVCTSYSVYFSFLH